MTHRSPLRPCGAIAVAALAAVLAAGQALAAGSFPFNGSFETISMGTPLGWQVQGAWFVRAEAAREGRNGLLLRADCTQAGDTLTTEGYLLVEPGETVKLTLSYQSATGGPSVGLAYCDAFGRNLAQGSLEALPAASSWTTYEREIVLGSDECPTPQGAVRPVLVIQQSGVQARIDAVSLSVEGTAGVRPLTPKIKAEDRPNLLINPMMTINAEGALPGWTAVDTAGYCKESATVAAVEGSATGQLALQGGEQAAAWLSDPVLLDGALPYVAGATLCSTDLTAGKATLLLRTLDPQNPRAVWMQREVSVPAAQPEACQQLALPRVSLQGAPMQAQMAVLLEPASAGSVVASAVTLQPEPLSLSVRAAASAGGFRRPQDVSLFIAAVNNTYAALKPKAYMKVFSSDGTVVTQEGRAIVIGSRSAAYFPYKPKLTAGGEYRLLVRIIGGGKDLGNCEYDFKVNAE